MPHNHLRLVALGRLTLLGAAGEEDASLAKRRFKLDVDALELAEAAQANDERWPPAMTLGEAEVRSIDECRGSCS